MAITKITICATSWNLLALTIFGCGGSDSKKKPKNQLLVSQTLEGHISGNLEQSATYSRVLIDADSGASYNETLVQNADSSITTIGIFDPKGRNFSSWTQTNVTVKNKTDSKSSCFWTIVAQSNNPFETIQRDVVGGLIQMLKNGTHVNVSNGGDRQVTFKGTLNNNKIKEDILLDKNKLIKNMNATVSVGNDTLQEDRVYNSTAGKPKPEQFTVPTEWNCQKLNVSENVWTF